MMIPLHLILLAAQVLQALPIPNGAESSIAKILSRFHASNPRQWNRVTLPDGQEVRTSDVEPKQFEDTMQKVVAKRGMPQDLTVREERVNALEKRPVIIVTPVGNRARSREGVNPFAGEKINVLEERGDPDSGGEENRLGILAKRPEIIVTPVVQTTKVSKSEKADDIANRGDPDSGGEEQLPRSILEKRPKIVVTPIDDAPKPSIRETDRDTGRPRQDLTYTSGRFSTRSLE